MMPAPGTNSFNSCVFLATTSGAVKLMPVTLPPGRLRLATSPAATGSTTAEKTTGIVCVAALAAKADGDPPPANNTETRRSMSSFASVGNRSKWPSAQRKAMMTFCPSINPASRNPRRNADTRFIDSPGPRALMKPITGMANCCARAANGQAAAETTAALTKSRRRIAFPQALEIGDAPKAITAGFRDARNGVPRSFCAAAIRDYECPLWVKSRHSGRGTDVRYYPESDRNSDMPGRRYGHPNWRHKSGGEKTLG